MNSDDVKFFIRKFDCCFSQAKSRNYIPTYVGFDNLTYISHKWVVVSPSLMRTRLHPLSIILEGRKVISGNIYPELESVMGLKKDSMRRGFHEGFGNNPSFTDGYGDLDMKIMFNVGRYLMNTYFAIPLIYDFAKLNIQIR